MAKLPNPQTCPASGQPFAENTSFISEHTGYRKCNVCGKSVAPERAGKVRWHKRAA